MRPGAKMVGCHEGRINAFLIPPCGTTVGRFLKESLSCRRFANSTNGMRLNQRTKTRTGQGDGAEEGGATGAWPCPAGNEHDAVRW